MLGDLVQHPTVPSLDGTAGTPDIDGSRGERASCWHTDVTFVPYYPAISILRAVTLPAYGGDTPWANTEAAYAELPGALRDLADRLWAVGSGERSLIVGHFIQRLLGLTTSDSQHLIAIFHDHATRPENTVRWSWRQGDVAIGDNRATVHRSRRRRQPSGKIDAQTRA